MSWCIERHLGPGAVSTGHIGGVVWVAMFTRHTCEGSHHSSTCVTRDAQHATQGGEAKASESIRFASQHSPRGSLSPLSLAKLLAQGHPCMALSRWGSDGRIDRALAPCGLTVVSCYRRLVDEDLAGGDDGGENRPGDEESRIRIADCRIYRSAVWRWRPVL